MFDLRLIGFCWRYKKCKLWETKILVYLKLKGLQEVSGVDQIDADKNELAFAKLTHYLEERSYSLAMRDAKSNANEALRILRTHYAESDKPRIIALYNQITS